jgi:hypothetical protein
MRDPSNSKVLYARDDKRTVGSCRVLEMQRSLFTGAHVYEPW